MKPAWGKLMQKYEGHESVLIADVDCTASGKSLCETHGIEGFPTIRYGDPADMQDHEGGRDYESLEMFAAENLKPVCSPSNIELCSDEKKQQITDLTALGLEALEERITEKDGEAEAHNKHFTAEVEKLQATYQELQKSKKEKEEEIQASGLKVMKAVKALKAKKAKALLPEPEEEF